MSYERAVEKFLLEECERLAGPSHPVLGDNACCPTGEPYSTFACAYKPEGLCGDSYESLSQAKVAFLQGFRDYAAARRGKLFWRHNPRVEREDSGEYYVYARLVISEVKETSHG